MTDRPRSVLFLVTEDWFFASHFLPMARAAREMGLSVTVVARVRAHREVIEATGARVVALEADRRRMNPLAILRTVAAMRRVLAQERPDIVHAIALRSIVLGGLAARLAGIGRRVYALTGLGFLGARRDAAARAARAGLRLVIRGALESRGTHYLFENDDDPRLVGLDLHAPNVTIVGGAGVDPEDYPVAPLPPQPPLKVAVVARMLWSKGIDLAVEAVRRARADGVAVELSLFGAPDPANPKAVPEATLRQWSEEPGIAWRGPTRDIAGVWREHHVACLPSRGGEGLPRTLLEGAASGRAILTTDVPGCRTLVRDGIEGLVVAPDDAAALAGAIARLAAEPQRVAAMGAAARARVLEGFTERHVMERLKALYRRMLAEGP